MIGRRRLLVAQIGQLTTVAERPHPAAAGPLAVLERAALVADEGMVTWLGPEADLPEALREGAEVLDAEGRCVIPGFVDSHTHPVFAGRRAREFAARVAGRDSYAALLARGEGGILSTVAATRAASDAALDAELRARAATMLYYGTTTFEAKSGYGLSTRDEVRSLEAIARLIPAFPGTIVPTFLGAHAIPSEYRGEGDRYVNLVVNEMLPACAPLAQYCDVFCDQGAFTVAQTRRILECAAALGLGLRLHADEIAAIGGAELAAELGCASADHLIQITPSGMEALAGAGVVATLLPGTSFCLAHGHQAPARDLIAAGVSVALASDCNPGTCFSENMQLAITFACVNLRLTVEEALRAATMGGARALRLSDRVGSLEVGKRADLVVLAAHEYAEIPYHFGVNLARTVVAGGRVVATTNPALPEPVA
ncbi:MAG TPA: imidazolonepropionase [Chloroflexota bacterium]